VNIKSPACLLQKLRANNRLRQKGARESLGGGGERDLKEVPEG